MEFFRDEIMPFVYLTCLYDGKCKSGCFSLNLLTQLCRENAAKNAVIPRVLLRGSQNHPDADSLAAAMDELHCASIIPTARKLGEIQAIGLLASFTDDGSAGDTSVTEKIIELTCEILLSPNTRGGLFLPQYVTEEKDRLVDDIDSEYNDIRTYASRRLIEQMCSCEDYAVPAVGGESEAENIYYRTLTKHYKNLLLTSPIEIFYRGNVPSEKVADVLRTSLLNLPRGEIDLDIGTEIRMNTVDEDIRRFEEEADSRQSVLEIGFRMGECMDTASCAELTVFAELVNHKLVGRLRDELGLCRDVSCCLHRQKGILEVSCDIAPEKRDEAENEVLSVLDTLRSGGFSDDDVSVAREKVRAALEALPGDCPALENYWLEQNTEGMECSPSELAALTEDVTREHLIAVADTVVCDAVYFLRGSADDAD